MDRPRRPRAQQVQSPTPVTGIPFSVVSAAVPAGFALALWHLLAVARGYVRDNAFELSPDLAREEAGSV